MNKLNLGAVNRGAGWTDRDWVPWQGRDVPRCSSVLTGPRRSMSSCLIWDTRASLATRALCRRSLNSISSPCISATWNTQARNSEAQGADPPPGLPHLLWAHLSYQQGIRRLSGLEIEHSSPTSYANPPIS